MLDLRNNRLTHLPESIGNLTRLEVLYLDDNLLISLPESLKLLGHIEVLSVGKNELEGDLPAFLFAWRDGCKPFDKAEFPFA